MKALTFTAFVVCIALAFLATTQSGLHALLTIATVNLLVFALADEL